MPDQLSELLDMMVMNIAQQHGWAVAEARQFVHRHIDIARAEYRQNGAPYGDDDAGFYRWLTVQHGPLTMSA